MPYYNSTRTVPSPTKECAPNPCPVCGGLECLCRPRFFAGQLLTEEDLNRLENYVIEKNKLHNRYLHGWGVVCGLEIICSPCAGQVTVTSGYALSPCGEDIVVCHDDVVNVCDLINKCKEKERRQWNCDPPSTGQPSRDQGLTEDWIFAIRYDEKSSKGVTPLKNNGTACCSRCSGASSSYSSSSSSCGCGCHGKTTNGSTKTAYKTSQKIASPQCEPTLICEGYVYEVYKVYKVYKAPPVRNQDCGPFIDRVQECMQEFLIVLKSLAGTNNTATAVLAGNDVQRQSAWLRSFQSSLQDLLEHLPVYNCALAERLNIDLPDVGTLEGQAFTNAFAGAANRLFSIGTEILRFWVCSAILPPCPDPVHDPRVPLAKITVSKGNCQLIRVCNLDTRKFVATAPNLLYWLSLVFPFESLHQRVEALCCQPIDERLATLVARDTRLFANPSLEEAFVSVPRSDCTRLLLDMLASLRSGRTVNPQRLMLGTLGVKDEQGAAMMRDLELKNPAASLLLNQLVRPLLKDFLPEQATHIVGTPQPGEAPAATPGRDEEINKLQKQLDELGRTLKEQQKTIEELKGRRRPSKN